MRDTRSESGFSLMEVTIATGLLLIVSSMMTSGLLQITKHQQTIWNRTEMHSGIRGATELLQQEVGQAGLITVPSTTVVLQTAVTPPSGTRPCLLVAGGGWAPAPDGYWPGPVNVDTVTGLWFNTTKGIKLTTLDGPNSETITVQAIDTVNKTITACFSRQHLANTPMRPLGGFPEGIIGPSPTYTTPWSTVAGTYVNGSDANHLKLFGDINGDGNLIYVEYFCDNGDVGTTPSHNLYRNVMAYDTTPANKPAVTPSKILLTNVYPNPADNGTQRPCFKYQWVNINGQQFVLDIAITLTVQTQQVDPVTRAYQTETKALLNVSPRNVFNTWMMVGLGEDIRAQATPPTVTALLP